jgi:hypothetical protein
MRRIDKEKSILGDRARGAKIGASEEGGRVSESECRKREQRLKLYCLSLLSDASHCAAL